jgi:enamine deaminase RidA (YjgF/YER057c/UK114 family)
VDTQHSTTDGSLNIIYSAPSLLLQSSVHVFIISYQNGTCKSSCWKRRSSLTRKQTSKQKGRQTRSSALDFRITTTTVSFKFFFFPSSFQFFLFPSSQIIRLGTDANPNMSSAVVHNGILTTMGVIDTTGETVEAQTQNILDKIDALLKEGGTDKSKLLTANIWLKDISKDFGTMNGVWVKWIEVDNKPIRACVEANLAFPSLLVEIQVTAVVE